MGDNAGFGGSFAETVRPWLGDHVAISIGSVDKREPDVVIAIEITDKAAALAALQSLPDVPEAIDGPRGFTIFDGDGFDGSLRSGVLAVGEDVILITNIFDSIPQDRPLSLAESETFRNTINQLPESAYWGIFYVDLPPLAKAMSTGDMNMVWDYLISNYGPMVAGAAFRDLQISFLDIVQTTTQQGAMSFSPVNPDFAAKYVPADVSMLIHGRDINAMYRSLLGFLNQIARFNGDAGDMQSNLREVYTTLSGILGMEFPEEVLGWMNGDFVAYARFDRDEILRFLEVTSQNKAYAMETFPADFAFVVEAGDAALAAEFVDSLGALLRISLVQSEQAIVRKEAVGSVEGYTVRFSIPIGNDMVPYEIALASNGNVVTLATRHLAEEILSGGPVTVRYAPNLIEAQAFFLNNASGVVYMDALGFALPIVSSLGITGPAIGNVFEDVQGQLETPAAPRIFA